MTLTGKKAISKVLEKYGKEITQEMIPLIEWEGYSEDTYYDTKGIATRGVGQTGSYADMSYPECFRIHKAKLIRYTPQLSSLPDKVQDALLVSNYRGTWGQSKRTRRLFNAGRYAEAAEEYLNNAEYRDEGTPLQIKRRFEYVAEAIRSLA